MPPRVRLPLLAFVAALATLLVVPAIAGAVTIHLVQGEQTVPVQRPGTTLAAAVAALVAGPTPAELADGFQTYVPPDTAVRSVTQIGSVAIVDLDARFAEAGSTEDLTARLTQLVLTATSLKGVKAVRVRILGGTPLGLFPGVDATQPITPEALRKPTEPPPKPPAPEQPADPTAPVRALQQRLADLGFLPAKAVDGVAGEQTRFAVVALQKWNGLGRDGIVGPQTRGALEQGQRPTPRSPGKGRRIEVLLDRQLALVIAPNGKVVRTISVSTGAAETPTPPGSYSVGRKEDRSWSVPFSVWLPWASYFVGGVAFHEYADVPPLAASHGCVRVPVFDARWLYQQTPVGTRVVVLERSA
jgi:hypothetical protein